MVRVMFEKSVVIVVDDLDKCRIGLLLIKSGAAIVQARSLVRKFSYMCGDPKKGKGGKIIHAHKYILLCCFM